eukprot:gene1383-1594_t
MMESVWSATIRDIDDDTAVINGPQIDSPPQQESYVQARDESGDLLAALTRKTEWGVDTYRKTLSSRDSSARLVAWSPDNFVAMALPPVVHGAGPDSIVIMRVDLPHEYIAVRADSHTSSIKYLEWSQQAQGSLLLSVDLANTLCLWKKKDHVDDWTCIETLSFNYLLLCRWVSIQPSFSPLAQPAWPAVPQPDAMLVDEHQHTRPSPFAAANTAQTTEIVTQTFITLSKDGKICIVTNLLDSTWKQIQGDIIIPLHYSIDCADIISLKDETIMIAIHSEKIGNSVLIYKVTYDIYTNYVNVYQTDKINLNDVIETDRTLLKAKRNMHVSALYFDNSDTELLVVRRGGDCTQLHRWQKTERDMSQHHAVVSLFGEHRDVTEWTCVQRRTLFHKRRGDNDIVAVTFSQAPRIVWLSHASGKIEALKSTTLLPISITPLPGRVPGEIVLSMAPSPNACLVACLTDTHRLQLLALPIRSLDKPAAATWMSHLFQASMLRTADWWDVLILLRIYSNSAETRDTYHYVISELSGEATKLTAMPPAQCRASLDAIKSSIYRITQGMELAFIDTQAKSFIYYLLDTLKSSYIPLCQQEFGYSPEDKDNMAYLIDWVAEFTYFFLRNVFYLNHMFKTPESKSEVSTFKVPEDFKDVEATHYYPFHYLAEPKSKPAFPFATLLFDVNVMLALFELLNYSKAYKEKYTTENSKVKFKDSDIKILVDVYTPFILKIGALLVAEDEFESIKSFVETNYQSITTVYSETTEVNNQNTTSTVPTFRALSGDRIEVFTKALFQLIPQVIPTSIIKDVNDVMMTSSFTILDLDPPLDGFLDQNPLPSTLPSGADPAASQVNFKYVPKSSEHISLVYDIITPHQKVHEMPSYDRDAQDVTLLVRPLVTGVSAVWRQMEIVQR